MSQSSLIEKIERIVAEDVHGDHILSLYFDRAERAERSYRRHHRWSNLWQTSLPTWRRSDYKTWTIEQLKGAIAFYHSYTHPDLHRKKSLVRDIEQAESDFQSILGRGDLNRLNKLKQQIMDWRKEFIKPYQRSGTVLRRSSLVKHTTGRNGELSSLMQWDYKYLRHYHDGLNLVQGML